MTCPGSAAPIQTVVVVVPVRNEEALLPRCLRALSVAVDALSGLPEPDRPAVTVLLVLDRCTDQSALVAAPWTQFRHCISTAGAVGTARRNGIRHALKLLPGESAHGAASAHTVWIATTDADSAVPPNWLVTQLALARNGADLVLGTVTPDDDLDGSERVRFEGLHVLADGHPHVHGANYGVRANVYFEAGEFAPVDRDEDVLLTEALRVLGVTEARTALIPVLTSGRRMGRAPAGFAGFLRESIDTDQRGAEAAN